MINNKERTANNDSMEMMIRTQRCKCTVHHCQPQITNDLAAGLNNFGARRIQLFKERSVKRGKLTGILTCTRRYLFLAGAALSSANLVSWVEPSLFSS